MRKPTIEDISRLTGLSRGTVSRALNDRPDISQKTKKRVLEACTKLDYSPSHAARALATGKNSSIALLIDSFQSSFNTAFVRGACLRAAEAHYVVHPIEIGFESATAAERVKRLAGDRIDGLVVAATVAEPLAELIRRTAGNRPVAACGPIQGIECDVIASDQVESGRLAARCVLANGPCDLLYVYAADRPGGRQRLSGFQEVCREHGIDPEAACLEVPIQDDGPEDLEPARARITAAPAIVADNDFLAVSIMMLCIRHGRMPGQDVAVIGQGNEPIGGRIRPTLTTVDFAGEEIGRRTLDVVLSRLADERKDAPQTTEVAPLLVRRESSGGLS